MSPSELIQAGERLYGKTWRHPLAEALGIDVSTLRRWTGGYVAIPRRTELAIRGLLSDKRSKPPYTER
jgi:hypothetical protein